MSYNEIRSRKFQLRGYESEAEAEDEDGNEDKGMMGPDENLQQQRKTIEENDSIRLDRYSKIQVQMLLRKSGGDGAGERIPVVGSTSSRARAQQKSFETRDEEDGDEDEMKGGGMVSRMDRVLSRLKQSERRVKRTSTSSRGKAVVEEIDGDCGMEETMRMMEVEMTARVPAKFLGASRNVVDGRSGGRESSGRKKGVSSGRVNVGDLKKDIKSLSLGLEDDFERDGESFAGQMQNNQGKYVLLPYD
jgi:hypothetical protein